MVRSQGGRAIVSSASSFSSSSSSSTTIPLSSTLSSSSSVSPSSSCSSLFFSLIFLSSSSQASIISGGVSLLSSSLIRFRMANTSIIPWFFLLFFEIPPLLAGVARLPERVSLAGRFSSATGGSASGMGVGGAMGEVDDDVAATEGGEGEEKEGTTTRGDLLCLRMLLGGSREEGTTPLEDDCRGPMRVECSRRRVDCMVRVDSEEVAAEEEAVSSTSSPTLSLCSRMLSTTSNRTLDRWTLSSPIPRLAGVSLWSLSACSRSASTRSAPVAVKMLMPPGTIDGRGRFLLAMLLARAPGAMGSCSFLSIRLSDSPIDWKGEEGAGPREAIDDDEAAELLKEKGASGSRGSIDGLGAI